jgi:4-hydroxy-2-oxoheptanedioate aldolase
MRENRLRLLVSRGETAIGTFLNFPDAALVEFTGLAGFDWVLFDAEHEGFSVRECYDLARAADAVGLATVVRVPRNAPDVLLSYAETGVDGILAPHISSVEAARRLVEALTFPPTGSRGVATNSRAANYGLTQSPADYLAATDAHTVPMALLEDDLSRDELDSILGISGLDLFAIGPGDLAASMGLPGEAANPLVQAKVESFAAGLSAAGKTLIFPVGKPEDTARAVLLGARFLVTSNAGLLQSAMAGFLKEVRERLGVGT